MSDNDCKQKQDEKEEKPGRTDWFKTINPPQKMEPEDLSKALTEARNRLEKLKQKYTEAKPNSPQKDQLALEIERVAGAIDGLKNVLSSSGKEFGVEDKDTETPDKAQERINKQKECFVAGLIYGPDAAETQLLRQFRDQRLRQNWIGRGFIKCYYRLGPKIVVLLKKWPLGRRAIKQVLDNIVARLQINSPEK